jgi:HAMP domain-containing protein
VLGAVRNFTREEFWGQHRYALALHTDEPHPHVQLVLKAVSEQGVRLNKKATLRHWRSEFARNLRLLGVEANATERAVRGETRKAKKDGIYRASLRGDSTYLRAQAVAAELLIGNLRVEPGKQKLEETRKAIEGRWDSIVNQLVKDGHHDLAGETRRFVDRMPRARTERESVAHELRERLSARRVRDRAATR